MREPREPPPASLLPTRPEIGAGEALEIVRRRWELAAETAVELPAERDRNFRVETGDGRRFVLKVAPAGDRRADLELRSALLDHIRERDPGLGVPAPVAAAAGSAIAEVEARAGGEGPHLTHLLTWLPGTPLADASPRSDALLEGIGRFLGRLDTAARDFEHPAADREHPWEIRAAPATIRRHLDAVVDPRRREVVEGILALHDGRVASLVDGLPVQVIHGDANDHNVLVGEPRRDRAGGWRRDVAGLIDFGDAVRSLRAAEPAVGAAYAVLGRPDPARAAVRVAAGYHDVTPLSDAELAAFFPLLLLRLALSVTLSAYRTGADPGNAYLAVSEAPAWRALTALAATSPDLLRYRVREACGKAAVPRSGRIVRWLEEHGDRAAPVLDPDPREAPRLVFDLSVASPELPSAYDDLDAADFSDILFGRMEEAGARVGVGRWGEPRRWYASDAYSEPGEGPERRTVHLGVDLFAPPGTPVRAPLPGRVRSVADNDAPLDYGPTVVVTHEPDGAPAFHTLYGHLSREVLGTLEPGDRVDAGEAFAAVGDREENGGWPPHLHFQIVTHVLGREGDFPGVAPPSERGVWLALSPDPNLVLGLPDEVAWEPAMPEPELREERRKLLGPTLSLSYDEPLVVVRGSRQHLYDREGRAYLDARNNVPHVGHAHPRVVEAARRQAGVLNTNTRYLHASVLRYARRLRELLPDELSVFHFVNSGSEANELALRMARSATGGREVVVVEGGYHGNTSTLVEISPYKFHGPGGAGAPGWVRVTPRPDPYRGVHRGGGAGTGERYARRVAEAAAAAREGDGLAAFVVEPLPGCAGQIVPPEGYLREAFRAVRAAGGVCVADEVQIGFGRVGTHWWAFEAQGTVPDILTLGKPMGNGHPLGAVVTTPAVARAFDTGMEYFNTFGGNPVSCEVGLAVLDVIRDEGLRENARVVGERLLSGLRELQGRHPVVGDVRGAGLYLGVELVRDPDERTPFADGADYVMERMKDRGILVGTDGVDGNVVKIKPPLCFTAGDADRLVGTMDEVLAEDVVRLG